MNMGSTRGRVQARLDAVTSKWWLYPLLLLLFFIPPYVSRGYGLGKQMDLVMQVLSHPLVYFFPALMPLAKAIPIVLFVGVIVLGNRIRRAFNLYVALLYLTLACFQSTAMTDQYGLVVLSGNLALILVVALLWIWEVFAQRNDFEPRSRPVWQWWVAPLALLALLGPVDADTIAPDFSPMRLLTSESGLTYCMMTPVILALLMLYYPSVNLALLRVTAFVGLLFGVLNMVTWFVLEPWGWWMGVLHIPLLVISAYAFVLAHVRVRNAAESGSPDSVNKLGT